MVCNESFFPKMIPIAQKNGLRRLLYFNCFESSLYLKTAYFPVLSFSSMLRLLS